MSPEEFGNEFGYENMTKDELAKRKQEVISKFKENAKTFSKVMN